MVEYYLHKYQNNPCSIPLLPADLFDPIKKQRGGLLITQSGSIESSKAAGWLHNWIPWVLLAQVRFPATAQVTRRSGPIRAKLGQDREGQTLQIYWETSIDNDA